MNRKELGVEIARVKNALAKTKSDKLTRDYSKYLKKLMREARDYDMFMTRGGAKYGTTEN